MTTIADLMKRAEFRMIWHTGKHGVEVTDELIAHYFDADIIGNSIIVATDNKGVFKWLSWSVPYRPETEIINNACNYKAYGSLHNLLSGIDGHWRLFLMPSLLDYIYEVTSELRRLNASKV